MKNTTACLLWCLLCCFFFCQRVTATTTWDDTKKGSWMPTTTRENRTLLGRVEWLAVQGVSTSAGLADSTQHLHVFTLRRPSAAAGAKLVVWAMRDDDRMHYRRGTLAQIAADYERTHSGWRVAAGINADQYYPTYGGNRGADGSWWYVPSPYYPAIIDGERRFPVTPYCGTDGFVAFTNDGSTESTVLNPTFAGFRVEVAGGSAQQLAVARFNAAPHSSGETVVWAGHMSTKNSSLVVAQSFTASSGSTVFLVEKAELAYMMNSALYTGGKDAFFGKGVVTKTVTSGSVGKGQFAIETKSGAAIKVGQTVTVQAYYTDAHINDKVEAASGFHTIHRRLGKDQTTTASYNTNRYSRSLFGRTSAGDYVLITADHGNGLTGINFVESNAVLKHYGLYDAFQDDGGGSVTALVGFGNGTFSIVNVPSDTSGPRSILDGLFFVVKEKN